MFSGAEGQTYRLFCEACLASEGFVQGSDILPCNFCFLKGNICHLILTLKWFSCVPQCVVKVVLTSCKGHAHNGCFGPSWASQDTFYHTSAFV